MAGTARRRTAATDKSAASFFGAEVHPDATHCVVARIWKDGEGRTIKRSVRDRYPTDAFPDAAAASELLGAGRWEVSLRLPGGRFAGAAQTVDVEDELGTVPVALAGPEEPLPTAEGAGEKRAPGWADVLQLFRETSERQMVTMERAHARELEMFRNSLQNVQGDRSRDLDFFSQAIDKISGAQENGFVTYLRDQNKLMGDQLREMQSEWRKARESLLRKQGSDSDWISEVAKEALPQLLTRTAAGPKPAAAAAAGGAAELSSLPTAEELRAFLARGGVVPDKDLAVVLRLWREGHVPADLREELLKYLVKLGAAS